MLEDLFLWFVFVVLFGLIVWLGLSLLGRIVERRRK